MKQIFEVIGNSQKLDGGAMFGNIPKAIWQNCYTPDNQNRITLACKALLVRDETKNILLETGIGAFLSPKLKQRFGVVEEEHVLLNSLEKLKLTHNDIDIVVLSHLHFDHAGGLLSSWDKNKPSELLFPKAKYIVSRACFERSNKPHIRDKASFIPNLTELLEKSNRLELIDNKDYSDELGKNYKFHFSDGHTPGMMLTEINNTNYGDIIFAADLVPTHTYVNNVISMGYDRFPELLIDEKTDLLNYVLKNNIKLFYTHDTKFSLSSIAQNDKGRFEAIGLKILNK